MTKLPHGCSASTSLRFVLLTLLALGAGVQQSHAQFDTLKVGTRSYMLVNEEEALEVIQGQTQQLVEYADTVLHLNGVLDLMIDSLGGAEAALVQAVDSILVLDAALETATDSIVALNGVWMTATDSIAALNGVWSTATDSIVTLNGVWTTATDSIVALNGVWTTATDSIVVLNGVWTTATDSIASLNSVWATVADSLAALNSSLSIATDSLAAIFSVPGCTYSNYMEYNPEATWENGSCANLAYPGCMDSAYLEYDATANLDDGSCTNLIVEGCTDYLYAEFDSAANVDDGSCSTYLCTTVTMDGYTYDLVQIGDLCWFAENLRTTITSQGTAIPYISDWAAWYSTTSSAQNFANNSTANLNAYGRLYNGFAALDPEGVCPTGWHVSSRLDWQELRALQVADGFINALGLTLRSGIGWSDPNGNLSSTSSGWDTYGFNGLPAGQYYSGWNFVGSSLGGYWSSTPRNSSNNYSFILTEHSTGIDANYSFNRHGYSIRCVLDRP